MFFNLSYMSEQKEKPKTIVLPGKKPESGYADFYGHHTDINGKVWHFNGYVHGCYLARPSQPGSYWESTTTNIDGGWHSATWKSYKVVWEEEEKENDRPRRKRNKK